MRTFLTPLLAGPLLTALAAATFATAASAEPPRVVVDIAPVHALVAQVMDGVAAPELLLTQNANPHAVQLKPSQARMLSQADLLVWVGPELSPWLDRLAGGIDGDQIALMENPATQLRAFTPPVGMEDDHAEEAGHEEPGDEHDHDHDHAGMDPHVWLSVDNARAWLGVFADDLALRDPDNAETYRANAARAQDGIDALADRIEARLAPHQGAEIVTFHAAFGYFADRFGIDIVGSVRPGDATSPSATAIAALEAMIAEHDIACAYAEPAFDPGLLETIAGDTGLRIGTLDATGALQAPGPDHYAATLEAVADGIAECLERE